MVWNCQRLIGISPGAVFLVKANNLTESRWMALTTAMGCCVTTASWRRYAMASIVMPGGGWCQEWPRGIADQAIDAHCGHHLRRWAQALLVWGQPERSAVSRRGRAPVEVVRISLGKCEMTDTAS